MASTVVLADIGGTNARFALAGGGGAGEVARFAVADYASFDDAMEHFLEMRRAVADHPIAAAIAIAGPVSRGAGSLTNSHWRFSEADISRRFGIPHVRLLNDFEALAWGLPLLRPEHLTRIVGRHPTTGFAASRPSGGPTPGSNGRLVAVGPGTGLGVACHDPEGAGLVLASEGGHVNAPSWSARIDAIIDWLRSDLGHVSVERMVSGQGLENTYRAVAALEGMPARQEDAAAITAAALDRSDPVAIETVEIFCAMLGEAAGNYALSFGASGGVYIAGGIAPRIIDLLQASEFRERFVAKGRFRVWLEPVPTWLVSHPNPTFLGLEAVATRIVGESH
ncbi:glucokinase [Camelimonas fluminis]|uniref:Glucokinase n=1 Tax=Camelimonas fluminis TaxID=1576911 RepID=A0ABV7UB54_9HYPH|nr:glucokinase [Camelimonas fluminis]GHE64167.1 glucokinase [Camelimonas fluminis]